MLKGKGKGVITGKGSYNLKNLMQNEENCLSTVTVAHLVKMPIFLYMTQQ